MKSFFAMARNLRRPIALAPLAYGVSQLTGGFWYGHPVPRIFFGADARSVCCEAQSSAGSFSRDVRRRPVVLLFGDSMTQLSFDECGWGAGLTHWFHRSVDVVNRGFSGYNSRWCRIILPGILETLESPLVAVTILLGANDSENTGQGVPLEEYEENLKAMIEMIRKAHPQVPIIAITPPLVDHERWPTRSTEAVGQYAAVVRGLPVTAVVDLWGHIEHDDLNDGLHLGPSGNRKLLALLKDALRDKAGVNPEDGPNGLPQMPMQYPHWSQLGGKTREQAAAKLYAWRWS